MKKILLTFALSITMVGSILADNFSVDNLTIVKGETANLVVNFQFDVANMYAGYQFELKLPDGVSTIRDENGVSEFQASSAHDATFLISNSYDAETGSVIFVALSLLSKALIGVEGPLLTIPVTVAEDVAIGSVLNGSIENIQLSKLDGNTTIFLSDKQFEITISSTTGISSVVDESLIDAYDVLGNQVRLNTNSHSGFPKGTYVLRMSNGKTKKVVMK